MYLSLALPTKHATPSPGWSNSIKGEGHKEVAELLLAHGADTNAKTREGETPSSLAKRKRHTQIVELLKKHGAKE